MNRTPQHAESIDFGPFRLDPARRLLRRGDMVSTLRPKTLQVLVHLLRHAGRLVSKEELLAVVWEGKAVSEYVLTTCISELRAAMGEEPRRPRYLETLHRAGYQMLVEVVVPDDETGGYAAKAPVVGRVSELQRLRRFVDDACDGNRRVAFITGEMGIGKTTLVERLLREIAPTRSPAQALLTGDAPAGVVARGHCIEPFGAGEPYMPVFEAIGRLGRGRDAAFVVETLRRNAPAWLVQIPRLVPAEERAALRSEAPTPTQGAMLRQIADGVEALAERRLLVLLLEDLHLSDPATLEFVAVVAKRRGPAHLLLLGTARTGEVHAGSAHLQGLVRDLVMHGQAEEIALAALSRESIATYLANRFVRVSVPAEVVQTLHARTEGNPLFLSQLVDQLVADGLLRVDAEAEALRADVG